MNTRKFLGVRRWLSVMGILSILSSLVVVAPIASAYTGADATTAGFSWAASAVDAACEKGLIDCDLSDPAFGQTVTRAVAYQMLTSGFGVLAETSNSPFADVDGAWYAAAAHTAYTLGWTAGVGSNADGAPLFGGAQTMTRSQLAVAAAKALGLSDCDESVLDSYTDAGSIPSWARGAMACMVENKLMVGSNNKLDPNGGANKAQVVVVMNAQVDFAAENEIDVLEVAADMLGVDSATVQQALDEGMNVVDGVLVAVGGGSTPTPVDPTNPEPPVAAGTLAVSAENMTAGTLADGTAFNPVLKLRVAASSSAAVMVKGVNVVRGGLTADSNVKFSVWDESGKRHGTVVSVSDNVAAVSFENNPITVAAGSSTVITVAANIADTAGTGTIMASVMANGLVTSAESVTGLPVMGASFGIVDGLSSVAAARMDVKNLATTTRSVDVGQKTFEVTKFEVAETASREDLIVRGLNLYNNGSVGDTDLTNITVYDQNNVALGSVAAMSNKEAMVTFTEPYVIPKGSTRNFSVKADVVNGSTRTAQFIVQNDYDVMLEGATTHAMILATATGNSVDTSFPLGDITSTNQGYNHITVNEGSLSISKDNASPSGDVTRGGADVVLGTFRVEALGEDIQLERAALDLSNGADRTGSNNTTGAFDCTSSSCDLTGSVKLVTEDGKTLLSLAANTAAVWNNSPALVDLSSTYLLKAGDKKVLKLVGSLSSNSSVLADGETLTAGINSLRYKKMSSLRYSTTTSVSANQLTTTSSSLTVSANSLYGARTMVGGTANMKIGSFVVRAGSAEGVNITSISLAVGDSTVAAGGTVRATNLAVKYDDPATAEVDMKQYGTTQATITDDASAQFSGNLVLAAGQQVIMDVYADGMSSFTSGTIIATLASGGVNANGATSSVSATAPANSTALQTITGVSSGRLTVTTSTDTPVAQEIVAGSTNVEVMKIKLEANLAEDVFVKELTVRNDANADDVAVGSLSLTDGVTDFGTSSLQADGSNQGFVTWNFSGNSRPKIPSNGSLTLTVKMNVVSSDQATVSNTTPQLVLQNLRAEGIAQLTPTNDGADLSLNNLADSAGAAGFAFGTTNATNLFAADGTATQLGAAATAAATTLTTNAAPTTNRTNTYAFIDQNDDATYDNGEEIVYVVEGTTGDTTLTVVRGQFNTTAAAADANDNVYFLGTAAAPAVAGNTTLVLNAKPVLSAAVGSPSGSATGGTNVVLGRLKVALTPNPADPAENMVVMSRLDLTAQKVGTQVTNLNLYPVENDNDSNYAVPGWALSGGTSSNSYRFDFTAVSNITTFGKDRITETTPGLAREYVLRGDVLFTGTSGGSLKLLINSLGTSSSTSLGAGDASSDVEFKDGLAGNTFYWAQQAQSFVDLNAQSLTYASGTTNTSDATAPTITAMVFGGVADDALTNGDTIAITFSERVAANTVNASMTPGGSSVALDGGTGDVSMAASGVVTVSGIATTDVDGGAATATTYAPTGALNTAGTTLTITLAGASASGALSAGEVFGDITGITTTVKDANGNALADSAVNASGSI